MYDWRCGSLLLLVARCNRSPCASTSELDSCYKDFPQVVYTIALGRPILDRALLADASRPCRNLTTSFDISLHLPDPPLTAVLWDRRCCFERWQR